MYCVLFVDALLVCFLTMIACVTHLIIPTSLRIRTTTSVMLLSIITRSTSLWRCSVSLFRQVEFVALFQRRPETYLICCVSVLDTVLLGSPISTFQYHVIWPLLLLTNHENERCFSISLYFVSAWSLWLATLLSRLNVPNSIQNLKPFAADNFSLIEILKQLTSNQSRDQAKSLLILVSLYGM